MEAQADWLALQTTRDPRPRHRTLQGLRAADRSATRARRRGSTSSPRTTPRSKQRIAMMRLARYYAASASAAQLPRAPRSGRRGRAAPRGSLLDHRRRAPARRSGWRSRIVESRCATTNALRPWSRRRSACSIRVGGDVHRARRLVQDQDPGSASSARAKATSCRWPATAGTRARRARCRAVLELRMNSSAPTARAAATISSSGPRAAESDVVGDRAREEEALLRHDPELRPERLLRHVAQIGAVDGDPAAGRVVEARDQLRRSSTCRRRCGRRARQSYPPTRRGRSRAAPRRPRGVGEVDVRRNGSCCRGSAPAGAPRARP